MLYDSRLSHRVPGAGGFSSLRIPGTSSDVPVRGSDAAKLTGGFMGKNEEVKGGGEARASAEQWDQRGAGVSIASFVEQAEQGAASGDEFPTSRSRTPSAGAVSNEFDAMHVSEGGEKENSCEGEVLDGEDQDLAAAGGRGRGRGRSRRCRRTRAGRAATAERSSPQAADDEKTLLPSG